jgi:glycosyltransferase involved in cell wall biosynthesis
VDFVGEVHFQFKDFVLADPDLAAVTSFTPSVSHKKLISMYGKSSLLLLILTGYKDAEGYMPGKLFEYMATGIPVLGTGPVNGDASKLLATSGAGEMIDGDDQQKIIQKVIEHYTAWSNGTTIVKIGNGKSYSRREITKELTELF